MRLKHTKEMLKLGSETRQKKLTFYKVEMRALLYLYPKLKAITKLHEFL